MRRGAELTADAFARRAAGEPVDTKTLVSTARGLVTFVHHHHASEDEQFWPVLRERFPDAIAALDGLTAEHHALDGELQGLTEAVDALASGSAGDAAARGATAAAKVRDLLEDPDRPAGYDHLMGNFPPPVRWPRPLLLRRYRARRKALGGDR